MSGFAKNDQEAIYTDGQRIILEIKKKYADYKSREFKLALGQMPIQMASWLPYEDQIDQKSLLISWQHDTKFFESIGHYVEDHICRTKTGVQLCRIYLKIVNQKSPELNASDLAVTLAKHLILAISEQRKILDSWSSNYITWLFIDPNEMTVGSLNSWIVHEMFQTIDIKNSTGGVLAASRDFTDDKLCAVTIGNLNREVRFASSAIRSYKIEDAIMTELFNKTHEVLSHMKKMSCQFNVEWAHIQLTEFYETMKKGAYAHQVEKIPIRCFNSLLENSMESNTGIEFGKKLFTQIPGTCEFLSEPDLDQIETLDVDLNFLETWFHGPRPRVGGT